MNLQVRLYLSSRVTLPLEPGNTPQACNDVWWSFPLYDSVHTVWKPVSSVWSYILIAWHTVHPCQVSTELD